MTALAFVTVSIRRTIHHVRRRNIRSLSVVRELLKLTGVADAPRFGFVVGCGKNARVLRC
jgi:hypothetical protein